jgi:pyruvate/2-oxoglutarate dehydrogenase complex dihydrolipoamide acyltransferase (E2) component
MPVVSPTLSATGSVRFRISALKTLTSVFLVSTAPGSGRGVSGKALGIPRVEPLCLSYDHHVIDGADGARFTATLARALSDPVRLLMEC